MTSTSCKLEPTIWPRDTGQGIPCFDRCQLIVALMSNIKEVHSKPRLYPFLEYSRHVVRLRRRRRRRAYAPTSTTASHDNHEKINSWVSFSFAWWVWGSAWRPFGPPELRYNVIIWSPKRPKGQQLQYRLKRTTEKHVFDSEWKHYKYVYRKKASIEFTKWSGHRVLWIFIHEKF